MIHYNYKVINKNYKILIYHIKSKLYKANIIK
jgi:hypothetical protein